MEVSFSTQYKMAAHQSDPNVKVLKAAMLDMADEYTQTLHLWVSFAYSLKIIYCLKTFGLAIH